LAAVFLAFFHVRWEHFASLPIFWQVDDGCYLRRVAELVGQDLGPGVCAKTVNYFAPGASLLLVPAGVLARVSAAIFPGSFSEWLVSWACLFGFVFWAGAVVLTDTLLSRAAPQVKPRMLHALALNLIPPVFYFAIHRQTVAHPEEWFVAVAFLVLLQSRRFYLAAAAATLLCLTRYNDGPAFLMLAGALWDRRPKESHPIRITPRLALIAAAVCAVAGYVAWVAFFGGYGDANGHATLPELLSGFSLSAAWRFFADMDWGILWTAPWFAAVLIWGLLRIRQLSWASRGALAWVLMEIAVCISWGGNGGMYGYRYLTGSYAALVWIALELVDKTPARARIYWRASAASAVWSLWLVHLFIGLSTLEIGISYVHDKTGVTRRIVSAPFLETGLGETFNGALHLAVLARQSPLAVWLASLHGAGEGAIPRLHGPTLPALTASVVAALLVLGLAVARVAKAQARSTVKAGEGRPYTGQGSPS
jgi:hypothetical protein